MIFEEYELVLTAFVAVIGWVVGHSLSWRREQNKKARDTRLIYLRSTYMDMTRLRSHASVLSIEEVASLLIGVLSDIELFGTQYQISLVHELAETIAGEGGKFGKSELLIDSLRNDLRSELNLTDIATPVEYYNYKKKRMPSSQAYEVQSTGERISIPIGYPV